MSRPGITILDRLARLWESCRGAFRRRPALPPPAGPPPKTAGPNYDAAIDKAFTAARRHERHLRRHEAQVRMILARFETEDELDVIAEVSDSTSLYARFRALLERSWALRYQDPARMIQLAGFAVQCSKRLLALRVGRRRNFDLQCEAHAAYANALRVGQQYDEAEHAMARARKLFELGTKDLALEIFLLEREAALDSDRRRFQDAFANMKRVYRGYRRLGDRHLAGRALVQLGIYANYAGHPEEGLAILRRSLELIDAARDPSVAYNAAHSQGWILCECRRFKEAERKLFEVRSFQHAQGGCTNRLKLRWLEGRIDAGLDRLERAERTLAEVRDEMAALKRADDAALAALDLAAVLMGLGKTRQAREEALAAYQAFVALQIHREALATLSILRNAFAVGIATRMLVEDVAAHLRKLEFDPEAKFRE